MGNFFLMMEQENEVINLYPHMGYQTMEGFGGAFTDAAGSVFAKMSKEQQDELIRKYFSPEQMNYHMVRIPVDSCDFSTHMYAADDMEEDEDFEHFSFQDVEQYILPLWTGRGILQTKTADHAFPVVSSRLYENQFKPERRRSPEERVLQPVGQIFMPLYQRIYGQGLSHSETFHTK